MNIARVIRSDCPLIIDLDGTLISGDTLVEQIVQSFSHAPLKTLHCFGALRHGRAAFKAAMAELHLLDASTLPYRQDVLDIISAAQSRGQEVHLVTAAHQSIAETVAEHLGVFDSAVGSSDTLNLKGQAKSDWLRERFPDGYIYAGDSSADLVVWKGAVSAVLVGDGERFASTLKREGKPFEIVAPHTFDVQTWMTQFRVHQWSKNILIFLPILLAHQLNVADLMITLAAFSVVSALTSATYVINDLLDIDADRRHATKRHRPIASGAIGIVPAIRVAICLVFGSFGWAMLVSPKLAGVMVFYLGITLAYSLYLKRIPLLDVTAIAALFTLRLVMGVAVLSLVYSPWLLSFSSMLFFSLALAKRHVELLRLTENGKFDTPVAGRGWLASDWPLSLAFGAGAALLSVLILILFVQFEARTSGLYRDPIWLYAVPAVVMIWIMRIWLLAHRKALDDDPVIFALKDRQSYALGFVAVCSFVLAS